MKRLAVFILVVLLVLLLTCCGSTTMIRGAILLDGVQSTSGLVSIVHLTVGSGPDGTFVEFTVVTLVNAGAAQTFSFCGNQVSQFPANSFVTATYKPGQQCSTLATVVKS